MAKSLQEYIDWLEERPDLIWPKLGEPEPAKATPSVAPLPGIRAVTWSVYGTLLRIADGELLFEHPQKLRMQIALEKTVEEFKMWPSMYRKPVAPWEYMHEQYARMLEKRRMTGTKRKGDVPECNTAEIWRQLVAQLEQKEYQYDAAFYGDADALSEKIAYFFQANLQAVQAAPHAAAALRSVAGTKVRQGLLADAQPFTLVQTLRELKRQGELPALGDLFHPDLVVLSCREEVRKPSPTLYRTLVERAAELNIEPEEILHVGNRLRDDLAVAKRHGLRTALYAGDPASIRATRAEVNDPDMRPDRLLTDLRQITQVLGK